MSAISTTGLSQLLARVMRPARGETAAARSAQTPQNARRGIALKCGLCVAGAAILLLTFYLGAHRQAIHIMWHTPVLRPLMLAGAAYASFSFIWTFWRLALAIRYKPTPVVADALLPRITIVVPAFNEGALVGETIRCLARADYPRDRLEIIVCDDGSTDDTWHHIRKASAEVSDRVRILPFHFEENRGKRWVLWEGFRRAAGDIFVTVDSDSLIEPDSLKALVSPLVRDEQVGGVAGNVRVLNRYDGIIPRMLAVRYVMTFDYKRAAQSMMDGGFVLCCAGALAAYRKKAVLPILDSWLHQTYLGGHARAGEDHAMTNFILKQGYHVRYQRTARVYTKSPTTYAGLAKMFLRWGRSNVRETIHTAKWIFTGFRPGLHVGARYNFINCAVGLALPYAFLAATIVLSLCYPLVFGLKLLAACVTGGLFSVAFFAARERSTEAVFGIVYSYYVTLLMGWVWPYALLTSHKSVWMTRVAAPSQRGPAQDSAAPLFPILAVPRAAPARSTVAPHRPAAVAS